jgi:dTDP-4-amino-4,6-dideoxygalactose transaminase
MVVLDKAIDRNCVIRAMAQKGIETNLGAQALHLLTYYKDTYGYDGTAFKTAADLYRNGLALPLYGKLQPADITYISQTLKGVLHEF